MPAVFLLRHSQASLQKSREALSGMADWTICGSAERLREAGAAIAQQQPDIVASDLRLLDGHADRLAHQLRQWPRRPQLLLLSPSSDDLRLFDALLCGASSYCIDTGDGLGLAAGLRQLADGRAAMSPAIARQTLALFDLGRSSLVEAQAPAAAQDLAPVEPAGARPAEHRDRYALGRGAGDDRAAAVAHLSAPARADGAGGLAG